MSEKKIVSLEELYAEYGAMRGDLFTLANSLPDGDDFKMNIIEGDKKIQELIDAREAKVKECHPDGGHWPPHGDCPLCQKVAEKWGNAAKKRCKELGLPETEENLEIALKDYLEKGYNKDAESHPIS